ncbi:MAG: hypothetical protein PVSMB1_05340 [Gemmatimonadaceae bacterium]
MLGSERGPVECEDSAALENAVDDRLRQVLIMQHAPPSRERLIRGEDHGALSPMAIVDHVEEHVRGVRAVREVAHFVDDQDAGMDVRRQDVSEPAAAKRGREIINEFGGGDKPRVEAILNRPIGDRHGQMCFAAARFPTEDQTATVGHEIRREG